MEQYLQCLFNPSSDVVAQAPDCFYRRSSVFKLTGNTTIVSSLAKGHVLITVFPQLVTQPANFITQYLDAASQLDVTNLPVIANLLASSVNGQTLSPYYSYVRLVAFEITLTYVGAELTQAGELSIGLDNIQQVIVSTNVKNNIIDGVYHCKGRSDKSFRLVWIPQDDTDFEFRATNATAKNSQYWGCITAAGTGFPVNIPVYDLQYTAVIEGTVLPGNLDFIPRGLSANIDPHDAMRAAKGKAMSDIRYLCSTNGMDR